VLRKPGVLAVPAPFSAFTPLHGGGHGAPLVCVHGFTDTWRTWELVLASLESRHDVLAPTLPGHAGGPSLPARLTEETMADAVERAMDAAGFETAHLVGNSLGGHIALRLAARGRARSVVAFAPAGGWRPGSRAAADMLRSFPAMQQQARAALPHLDRLVATPEGRRRATELICEHGDELPAALVAHLLLGVAACSGVDRLTEAALTLPWELEAAAIECPVRIVWGLRDRVLRWPGAAVRYREEWLPNADWVELDGVGHCPQLDVPAVAADLIAGFTPQ
jgi:pimeloyl-ACP methyl ester carboxylesterase